MIVHERLLNFDEVIIYALKSRKGGPRRGKGVETRNTVPRGDDSAINSESRSGTFLHRGYRKRSSLARSFCRVPSSRREIKRVGPCSRVVRGRLLLARRCRLKGTPLPSWSPFFGICLQRHGAIVGRCIARRDRRFAFHSSSRWTHPGVCSFSNCLSVCSERIGQFVKFHRNIE